MLRIGLTGSIAAGKSTLSNFFIKQGVALWDADRAAREVVRPGEPALADIARTFGAEVLQEDGQLDREKLGEIIFANEEKRHALNAIVHPAVFENMNRSIANAQQNGEEMIVLDIPLLFETGMQREMDIVCLVYCNDAIRLKRLMERDDLTKEEAEMRMASQMPQAEKCMLADEVIDNSGSREDTLKQAGDLLDNWRKCRL